MFNKHLKGDSDWCERFKVPKACFIHNGNVDCSKRKTIVRD
jgi:hypothetical protein